MRMLFFEGRKIYFRKYIVVMFLVLSLLNVVKIAIDHQQNVIDPVTAEDDKNAAAYKEMYDIAKGSITNEIQQFIDEEEQRLSEIYNKGLNPQSSQEKTYSGNLREDYRLLELYIAREFHYMTDYSTYSNQISSAAQENIDYYQKKENLLKVKENAYIKNNYENRIITQFYRTAGVESYLNYGFSIVLVILLCFLGTSPAFTAEHECKMDKIIITSRNGGRKSTIVKILASMLYSLGITVWFCLLDLAAYQILYGFEGLNNPIYAIETYRDTYLNCTIWDFMVHEMGLKILAVLVVNMIILFLSCMMKKNIHVAISFAAVMAGLYLLSQNIFSISKWKTIFALLSPFSLFGNRILYQGFYYVEWGQNFLLKSTISIVGSIIVIVLAIILILVLGGSHRKCKRSIKN